MRKLVKKLKKESCVCDKSDGDKNPYASSVSHHHWMLNSSLLTCSNEGWRVIIGGRAVDCPSTRFLETDESNVVIINPQGGKLAPRHMSGASNFFVFC